jgi:hypothetical protein
MAFADHLDVGEHAVENHFLAPGLGILCLADVLTLVLHESDSATQTGIGLVGSETVSNSSRSSLARTRNRTAQYPRRFAMLARRFIVSTVAVMAMAVPCVGIRGDSLTTLYNPTSHERGNMFDVTTFDAPVRMTSLDIHTQDTTGNRTLQVYTRPGTYVGHESSSAGWTLHSLVPGITGQGHYTPTSVDIHDLYLPAGTTTGLYVTFESGNLGYTNPVNAPGTLTTYGGPANHLQLDLGAGLTYPFGTLYSPRIWNGTVHYDVLDAMPGLPQPQPQIFIDGGNGVIFSPESKWNTIHATMAGASVALYDPVGVPTGVTATLSSGWTNSSAMPNTGKYAGTILEEATTDYMYLTTENTSGTLTLDGLADAWYRVEMSASRSDSSNRLQDTTLNGAWADGDHTGQNFSAYTHGHEQGTILLWRARPIDGVLTLEVSRGTAFGYLNALVVTQLPEPQPKIYIDAGNRHVFSAYDKWNTIHAGMTGTPIALYDPDGIPTGATLTIEGTWNNLDDSASQTGAYANTHPVLAEASSDSIWIGSYAVALFSTRSGGEPLFLGV